MLTIWQAINELLHQAFICKLPEQAILKESLEMAVLALHEKLVREGAG